MLMYIIVCLFTNASLVRMMSMKTKYALTASQVLIYVIYITFRTHHALVSVPCNAQAPLKPLRIRWPMMKRERLDKRWMCHQLVYIQPETDLHKMIILSVFSSRYGTYELSFLTVKKYNHKMIIISGTLLVRETSLLFNLRAALQCQSIQQ